MTTSGGTSDNEKQRVIKITMSGTTNVSEWQRVTTNDSEWQQMTINDSEWQQVVELMETV